jgi:hypothetical protein
MKLMMYQLLSTFLRKLSIQFLLAPMKPHAALGTFFRIVSVLKKLHIYFTLSQGSLKLKKKTFVHSCLASTNIIL